MVLEFCPRKVKPGIIEENTADRGVKGKGVLGMHFLTADSSHWIGARAVLLGEASLGLKNVRGEKGNTV